MSQHLIAKPGRAAMISSAQSAKAGPKSPDDLRLAAVRMLTRWMDEAFSVPGTRLRIGLDGLVGLIPGVGDSATALVSLFVIYQAQRLGLPRRKLLLMLGNVFLDWLLGLIPFFGDIADFALKANRRNLRIIERHLSKRAGGI